MSSSSDESDDSEKSQSLGLKSSQSSSLLKREVNTVKRPPSTASESESESDGDDSPSATKEEEFSNHQNRLQNSSDSSSSEEEGEQPKQHLEETSNIRLRDSGASDETSDGDDSPSATKEKELSNHQSRQQNSSDSSSSEEEGEQPKQHLEEKTSNISSRDNETSDETSDDEGSRQMVQKPQQTVHEDSSEDEPEIEKANSSLSRSGHMVQKPQLNIHEDSSEDETDVEETKPNPACTIRPVHSISSSDSDVSDDVALDPIPETRSEFKGRHQLQTDRNLSQSDSDESDDEQNHSPVQQSGALLEDRRSENQIKMEESSSDESSINGNTTPKSVSQVARVKLEMNLEEFDTSPPHITNKNEPIFKEAINHFEFPSKTGEDLLNSAFKECVPQDPMKSVLSLEEIKDDEEIWLIQCPRSMDLTRLKKQHLLLGGSSDFQLEDGPSFKRFSVSSEPSQTHVNCVLPSSNSGKFHIASLPIKGKMVIQEHVHVPKLKHIEINESRPIPLPLNLRTRHPLLGVGFEKHIANVKSALEECHQYSREKNTRSESVSLDKSQRSKKKNKKRKRESLQSTDVDDVDGSYFVQPANTDLLVESAGREHKKKKYFNLSSNDQRLDTVVDDNDHVSKKHKKQKKSSELQVDNSKTDDPTLNETHLKKHKKSKATVEKNITKLSMPMWHTPQIDSLPTSVLDGDSNVNTPSKQKKKKNRDNDSLLTSSEIKQEVSISNGSHESSSKKKRKKESKMSN